MKILSLETSGSVCSVCLSIDKNVVAEYSIFKSFEHDRLLAVLVQRILDDFQMKVSDLDAVAVSSGPGSFTGLRIGAAFAKALCFDNNPKLIAVPTLSAIALSAIDFTGNHKDICCAISSHKDFVYFQKFDKNGNPLSDIIFDTIDNVIELCSANSLLCGNGFSHIGKKSLFCDGISSTIINKLAVNLFETNSFIHSKDFIPMYVQEFVPRSNEK
ncbi:MAG TPA: tRNA (adenosine(37)-N6)-threonylcarbamoyltransferase complex dimerization subunit type 1 TsaB [Candidatus Kapabacteria bacterium]|jgi:tRNA threonylcarbamoyladenosine biosynthesis protein TsaB|nr:tRNA (adenosine(37)-N6)-threonylcarbamoyltransferase complex dimerization subunit type 1 TsaB [Candidatus Kapabacteria bacterium]HOQ49883.1 tRNA (adenosine(37)-N6)-threonylcarbamoyltransferase complex dimerization subunit type 1 TsaB [Candidatus Kapabacteria bacterium]HPP39325.1 tRNA (adenosine(37)-N6)-threonylcarbamoyltransferase complex dimerization subunit type 1 TsaB [Candidatus Kapabacteria bacterium]HPU22794.1 tRNA (adenosine(37)-N6)-threonylcarbamoyltransferase complex dimerization sub